jgi:IS30 family transposase
MARHLTLPEREVIQRMKRAKKPIAEIAETLGRARSTIYREIDRNAHIGHYNPSLAQRRAEGRRRIRRRRPKLEHRALKKYVVEALEKKWSPDQIAGRSRLDFKRDPDRQVSHQTIYRWLHCEAVDLREHLRRGRLRKRAKTRGKFDDAARIADRPQIVESKLRYGDWEGDTVVSPGKRSGIVTMVDRKSKFLRVRKTSDLKSATTMNATCRAMEDLPEKLRRTVTLDNGSEFAEHRQLTEELGLEVYFARPYASWQRGLNENTNGLLRQFFPKGTDFSRISHHEVARAEKLLNERPRKSLGYKTPTEILAKRLCCN